MGWQGGAGWSRVWGAGQPTAVVRAPWVEGSSSTIVMGPPAATSRAGANAEGLRILAGGGSSNGGGRSALHHRHTWQCGRRAACRHTAAQGERAGRHMPQLCPVRSPLTPPHFTHRRRRASTRRHPGGAAWTWSPPAAGTGWLWRRRGRSPAQGRRAGRQAAVPTQEGLAAADGGAAKAPMQGITSGANNGPSAATSCQLRCGGLPGAGRGTFPDRSRPLGAAPAAAAGSGPAPRRGAAGRGGRQRRALAAAAAAVAVGGRGGLALQQ